MNPVLNYVMGIDAAKSGRMPTEAEHAQMRRIMNEAMDAGACGWSAQRLKPEGFASVQRDYDGTPMNTDVMHDETCLEMARVLGARGEGFQELTLVSGDVKTDAKYYEQIAEVSGRPIMFETVSSIDRYPTPPSRPVEVAGKMPQSRTAGLWPRHHDRRRPELHLRGLEPVRRRRHVARSDGRHRGGAQGKAWRSAPARGAEEPDADGRSNHLLR